MINAIKEYYEVCVIPGVEWTKKHWKGYLVFLAICWLVPIIGMNFNEIKDHINNILKRDEKES